MAKQTHWFVQIAGETIGPLSSRELRELAERNGLTPETLVSTNGERWIPAHAVRGLKLLSAAASPAPSLRAHPSHEPQVVPVPSSAFPPTSAGLPAGSSTTTLALIILAVIGGSGVLLCAGLMLVGSLAGSTSNETGERTLAYWIQLQAILGQPAPQNQSTAATVAWLRRSAQQIRSLPVAAIDSEALQCAADLATFAENMAAHAERNDDASILFELLARSFAGDPWGTAVDAMGRADVIRAQYQTVHNNCAQVRLRLAQRYRVEFPALPF